MASTQPAVPSPRARATYADLLAVPDHRVAEILDGELVVSPRPASPHAFASSGIGFDVGGPFHRGGQGGGAGGWWILFEPELHLGRDVLVPDIAGWRTERMPTYPDVAFFQLAPDWICEVASPSTVRIDRVKKLDIYAREGVGHVWLVDPLAQLVECFRLEGGRWLRLASHGGDARARLEPFDAVEFELARWWPPTPESESPAPSPDGT
jgi:Uma2 family endonuclease